MSNLFSQVAITNPESKTHLIEVLSDLSRYHESNTDGETKKKSKKNSSTSRTESVASLSYDLLLRILNPIHGTRDQTITLVFKNLLPNVLMTFGGLITSAAIPKSTLLVREETLKFIR
jgi:hypothetical protein